MKIIPKVWGYEIVLVSNELYSCKIMAIKGAFQCSIHYHKLKDETFTLLAGSVRLEHGKSAHFMDQFKQYRIKPGTKHRFAGFCPWSFVLEVATEDKADDSYRETKSGRITENDGYYE